MRNGHETIFALREKELICNISQLVGGRYSILCFLADAKSRSKHYSLRNMNSIILYRSFSIWNVLYFDQGVVTQFIFASLSY